jgi:hypothetical protein
VSRSQAIGIAADLPFLHSRRADTAFCPCGVRNPGVCLVSATQVLDHVPSNPAESSCISPSHCRPGPGPGTPLSHRPAAADARHSPRPYMRRIVSHLGNPIRTASIVHTPAKDSRASPGPVRPDRSARSCHGCRAPAISPTEDQSAGRPVHCDLCWDVVTERDQWRCARRTIAAVTCG